MSSQKTLEGIMHKNVLSVKSNTSIFDTVNFLKIKKIGAVAIIDDKKIIGMFSERDLVNKVVCADLNTKTTPIKDVMTSPVITTYEESTYQEAYVLMNDNHIRHLPVVNSHGEPVGMVGTRDLMQAIMQDMIESFLNEDAA